MKIRIFTDGACSGNPGPGGWAAVILLPNEKQYISGGEKGTTNNRMELKAVVEALRLTLRLGYKKIYIYSDSAYVVNAKNKDWLKKWAENGWKTKLDEEVKNKDLWQQLIYLLSKSPEIHFIKVKGHSGIKNNENVDTLAKNEVTKFKNIQAKIDSGEMEDDWDEFE